METILGLKPKEVLSYGAEAILLIVEFYGTEAVLKIRKPKAYRNPVLDAKIRGSRTVLEAKLLSKACLAGVNVPALFAINKKNSAILMEYVRGKTLSEVSDETLSFYAADVGKFLGLLHAKGIIHGDVTLTNILLANNGIFFVDFGLGEFSYGVEQRAVDVNLLLRVLRSIKPSIYDEFVSRFRHEYKKTLGSEAGSEVFCRVEQINLRGRYVPERREKSAETDFSDE
jgi:TP53 regulating kinase-like protein